MRCRVKTAAIIIRGGNYMANNRSKTAFENMKYEIASQVGVNLKQGYNGDLASRDAGKIGGNIVKKVFEAYTGNTYQLEKK
jgi:hypothetical protein